MTTIAAQQSQREMLVEQPAPMALAQAQPLAASALQAMPQQAVTPADLLRIAMQQNDGDIARLERLMAMDERYREQQERERQREAVLAFRRDFAGFRGENVVIPKSKFVDRGRAGSFYQAEFEAVCRMLSPALSRHGFGFRHDMKFGLKEWPLPDAPNNAIGWVTVTCFLEHRDGHVESLVLEGPEGDQSANTPVQNMQVTASFLKRQSLLAITGTATGGEDDEGAMHRKQEAEPGATASEHEALLDAGQDAAMQGMVKLNEWWGSLTAKQRNAMTKDFGAMRKAAQAADAEGK